MLAAREWREQLSTDQIAAEHEEKIDANPAEAMHATGQRQTHNAGVVNEDHDNREGAEKIEARLTFAICEARINSELERRSCFSR